MAAYIIILEKWSLVSPKTVTRVEEPKIIRRLWSGHCSELHERLKQSVNLEKQSHRSVWTNKKTTKLLFSLMH